MRQPRRTRRSRALRGLLLVALVSSAAYLAGPEFIARAPAQTELTDADLVNASGGRTVAVGAVSGGGEVSRIPLELYVARVLAGEGEPNAADAARQALAVAIRTYTMVQIGRHRREGFDLCDTVHCQVLRAANEGSRRAALSTAGRVLTIDGAPAEVYYSASCGGRTEGAAHVWPGATFPYMQVVRDDDVHAEDVPWTLEFTLAEVRETLVKAGFGGRALRDIEIDSHTPSGRVDRLRLPGLRPNAIAATAFRDAFGTTRFRSTAFSLARDGNIVRFTGRGYGHGVGMCVIGAGRRARRGESVETILAQYYPNLTMGSLGDVTARAASPPTPPPPAERARVKRITAIVPRGSSVGTDQLEELAGRAYESLSRTLGTTAAAVTVQLHETLDGFRLESRQPWWVSAAVTGTTIDLAPAALLSQRDGLETTLRAAMAELLMSGSLAGRPAWVRVGGARYFSAPVRPPSGNVTCPADAELTLAVSAVSQREAESRAIKCFARALARIGDWRSVQ
jgi:SpoIID/LytB domain protein